MKKIQLLVACVALLFVSITAQAQLTGTKTIPGDYATLAAAIQDLNTVGVGAGGVTINLTQAETAPAGGFLIGSATLNGMSGSANPIVINGGGNTVTGFAGTQTNVDAIIRVAGTDYVTLNGFVLVDNAANTTTTSQMERGIWGCVFSQNDGCQNLTITNCNINLSNAVGNAQEVGILVNADIYSATGTSATYTQATTVPTSSSGYHTNITIQSNTISNCFNGIMVRGNLIAGTASITAVMMAQTVMVGGNSPALGNTITNFGLQIGGLAASGILVVNSHDHTIQHNTVSTNLTSLNTTAPASLQGIASQTGTGFRLITNNDISIANNTTVATTNGLTGIAVSTTNTVGYPLNTTCTISNNNIHDFNLAVSTGAIIVIQNTVNTTGAAVCQYNTISNITRSSVSGTIYGVFGQNHGTGTRSISYNTFNNMGFTGSSGTAGSVVFRCIETGNSTATITGNPAFGPQSGEIKGNVITNVNVTGTLTTTHNVYLIVASMQTGSLNVDSNTISGVTLNVPNANFGGIYGLNLATMNITVTRNNINNINKTVLSTTAGLTIDGIALLGTGNNRIVNNNFITGITCSGCHLDNAVKGISLTGSATNPAQIYYNTIYLGSGGTLTSSAANFGVSGISYGTGSIIDLRNNIIHVKATPSGTGIVSALRSSDAGTSGTPASGYATTSNNNIFYAPNAANSFLYAEGLASGTIVNSYNLTNDAIFNTGCSAFKAFAGGRETNSFTEDNLVSLAGNTFAPTGNTFAESGAQNIGSVTIDYNSIPRNTPSDMGAMEFSGNVTDAATPLISYSAPYYSFLCVNLPTLSVNITDVSGVNSGSGTKPRLYYKKTGDADAYVGNTSADNGWKYVEASNSSSPFTFTFDGSILQTAPAVNDVFQYFIVAQDSAGTPNVAASTVSFASGYCPTSVALTAAAFPTQNTLPINTLLLANYGNTTLTPSANPTNACLNGSTVLTVIDTILAPGIMPTGYYNPTLQITGATLDDIRRVQVNTTALNNSSTCAATGGSTSNGLPGSLLNRYSNYTSSVAPITITPGSSYTVSLDLANCTSASSSTGAVAIFLDVNRNGTFEANEKFASAASISIPANNATTTTNITMAVPSAGAVNGPTLMRVVFATGATNGAAITPTTSPFASGEVEDYQVYINSSQVMAVNTLPSSAFVWTSNTGATISTNPNRTVTASNLTANTTFTVTSTDPGGCISTNTILVNIATPVIATGVTGNASYCNLPNAQTTLTVTTANGSTPITSAWTGGSVVSTNGLSATLNPSVGTTTYTVIVTDACGTTSSTTVDVIVNPIPTTTFTPSGNFACGGSATRTAVGAGASSLTYLWLPGNLAGPTQTLTVASTTVYTVTTTSAAGCSSTATLSLTNSPNPTITSITANPTIACAGDSVQITSVATSGATYSWTPTTGLSNPNVLSPKAAPFSPTVYSLTVTTAAGCSVSNNVLVNVHPLFTNANGSKSATPPVICAGASSTVDVSITSQCGGTTAGFQQGYAPASWTLSQDNSNGSVITTGAPANIQLKSGNNLSGNPGSTNYQITVGCSGTISFNWSYSTSDFAYNDYPKYKLNGGTAAIFPGYQIAGNSSQTGTFSLAVNAGDIFQLQAFTEDNDPIQATITLTSFSGPAAPLSATATLWSAVTGGTNLGTPPQSFSPAATTMYYIQYTQTGTGCVNPFRDSIQITVNPQPTLVVGATPNDTVCIGSPVTLNASGAVNYTWNGNATATSDTTLTPAVAGVYTVVGSDAIGCSNSATVEIWLNSLPTVTASASLNDTVCNGDNVTLQGGGASSYTWNGIATSTSDTTLTPAVAGTYTVVGTDAFGCSNSATQVITVNTVSVTATANPGAAVCTGSPVTLMSSGASTYTWNGISTSTSDTTITPAVAGTYTVVGTDALGCTGSNTIAISLLSLPTVTASVSNATPCPNSTVTFTGGGATSYSWSGGVSDGVPAVPTSGTYTVTGTDGNGCSNTSDVTVTIGAGSPDLSNATAGNTSSTSGISNGTDTQVGGSLLNYYSGACNLIVGITSSANLGATQSTVNVEGTVLTHNGQPFVPRWFQITPAVNGPAVVTFYLTQDDFDDYNTYATANAWPLLPTGPTDAAGIANLVISKNDDTGLGNNPLVIAPTSVTWNSSALYWEVVASVPGFSQFRFHAVNPTNAALPVVVKEFTGKKLVSSNELNWITSSEKNNAYFNVQHSTDGKRYTTIAQVQSKGLQGNSDLALSYSVEHSNYVLGHNYYRLEQVDIDGKATTLTKVIDLNWSGAAEVISIYPNPVKDILFAELYTPKQQNVQLTLSDMSGRIIAQTATVSGVGNTLLDIPTANLANGLYTLEIRVAGKSVRVEKFTKE
jgi:hypothetical protein